MSESSHNGADDPSPAGCSAVELDELLAEFYQSPSTAHQLAEFESVESVPAPYDELLNHSDHMTVTIERFHDERVNVAVHRCHTNENWYSREIVLTGSNSEHVVQYGIVRLNIDAVGKDVWRQIETQEIPLGRVLIENDVLRQVQLCRLWKVKAGPSLASLVHCTIGDTTYGRTALIYCNGEPAIQLLEIVVPADQLA